MKTKDIYLLLGTNLGEREHNLAQAIEYIEKEVGEVQRKSTVVETDPWGFEAPTKFLNQVLEIESNLNPFDMLTKIKNIEQKMGRESKKGDLYESRVIDIDILFFENEIVNDPKLTIPHPQLHNRLFALMPLNELSPEYVHPVLKKTMETLLKEIV